MNRNFKRKLVFVKVCSPFSFIRFEKAEKIFKKRSPQEPILSPPFASLRFQVRVLPVRLLQVRVLLVDVLQVRVLQVHVLLVRVLQVQSSLVQSTKCSMPLLPPPIKWKNIACPPPPKKNYPPKKKAQSSPVQSLAQSSPESSSDFPTGHHGPPPKKKEKKKKTDCHLFSISQSPQKQPLIKSRWL